MVIDLGNPVDACKYGMGLDQNGDIWVGHCFGEGVSHYTSTPTSRCQLAAAAPGA